MRKSKSFNHQIRSIRCELTTVIISKSCLAKYVAKRRIFNRGLMLHSRGLLYSSMAMSSQLL